MTDRDAGNIKAMDIGSGPPMRIDFLAFIPERTIPGAIAVAGGGRADPNNATGGGVKIALSGKSLKRR